MSKPDLFSFLKAAYANEPWPRPFHILEGLQKIAAGATLREAAQAVGTSAHFLEQAQRRKNPEFDIIGLRPADLTDDDLRRAGRILGGLLLGRVAEIVFEDIYREQMGPDAEFKLIDLREGRTDTDYRLLNGKDRPIYRINIKFVGSTFRRAPELVGLEPRDCFPLATYKIFGALQKQDEEHLPYIFAIVGVPNLTAVTIQTELAHDDKQIIALISRSRRVSGKRNIEDKIVERIVAQRSKSFIEIYSRIRSAEWYVLSARRADKLLREQLFERVYALKIRGFAQQFRSAEARYALLVDERPENVERVS